VAVVEAARRAERRKGGGGKEPHMITKVLARSLYGLFGVLYLVAGGTVLLFKTGLLPDAVRGEILHIAQDNLNGVHLMQEFGSLLIFVGLITLWFTWHYKESRLFHWAMTAFWGLLALIHWFDVRGPVESAVGPAINTIPFALFFVVGLLRLISESGARS
jgi:hypothetical protein